MPDLVNVTIDDIKVQVPPGTLVIDAAKAAGIDIPIFCSHPKLDPLGACRMCLVEFPGPRGSRLDTACTIRVSEGMTVVTNSQAVREAREAVLGFILINHPLDCPICDKGGECPLQDNTMEYGPGASKFVEAKRRKQKHYPISDLIMLDQERCILCWRCIRYLEEWEDKPQIGLFERGGETVIDVFPGKPVDAKTSGSIIDICPVGALTNRVARFKYRPWELRKTPSICTHCPVGCNLRLDERVHTLRRIVARENMAVNDEWICDKGRFLHQHVDHPDRLKTPMIRENGALRPATWDEALATIVDRLEALAEGSAPIGGIAGGRVSNETAYLFQKFFRVFTGANNIDFSEGSGVRAQPAGLSAIANIARSDVIVLVDFDPSEAAPLLDLPIKRAIRRKGAKLIIINPRQIELTRYTAGDKGAYIPVRPGDSAAALNNIAAEIQRKKEEEKRKIEDPRRKRENLQPSNLQTSILLAAKAPLFIYGPDAARSQAVAALGNLAALLGRGEIAYTGHEPNGQGLRDMGLTSDSLPGQLPVADPAVRERLGKLWGVQPPAGPGLTYTEMLEGGVKALYIVEADPGASPRIAAALSQLEFLVVQDLFLTETAQLAHVVLPTTSWAESDGTYTNLERRVQRAPAGIDPVDGTLPGWAILTHLAERWLAAAPPYDAAVGADLRVRPAVSAAAVSAPAVSAAPTPAAAADWKRKKRAQATRTGPTPKPWTYASAQSVLEEITRAIPAYANLRWEALTGQGRQWTAAATEGRWKKEEGKSNPATFNLPPGTFRLIASPVLWDGSPLMQRAADQVRQRIPAPYVALNPTDLSAIFLLPSSFNRQATVTSALASVTLELRADPTVPPGAAWVPYGLPGLPAETLGAGRGEPISVTIALDHPSLE